jgi:hypothetical protein
MCPTNQEVPGRSPIDARTRELAALGICVAAAVSATLLTGLSFPGYNNVWHLPVVLNFADSTEGPHDAYDKTFSNFVSAFWIPVRWIATESNVERVFVGLQLLGNAISSLVVYAFLRSLTGKTLQAAIVSAGFCFCYGLWGLTRLGYSEILFVTYATHSQFAISACLLCLLLIMRGQWALSALVVGIAAAMNLFIAAWAGMAAALCLAATQRRLLTRSQVGFLGLSVLCSSPILVWAASKAGSSGDIPLEFFRSFQPAHFFALGYPQAAVQTFALAALAALAVKQSNPNESAMRGLGRAQLCALAVLCAGAVLPYLTDIRLLLLLQPLRFTSIVVDLSAICTGALLVQSLDAKSASETLAMFVAAAGFILKSPVVSVFALALIATGPGMAARWTAIALCTASVTACALMPTIIDDAMRSVLAFLFMCLTLATAILSRADDTWSDIDALRLLTAVVLGALVSVPRSAITIAATAFAVPAVVGALDLRTKRWKQLVLAADIAVSGLVLFSVLRQFDQASMVAAGLLLVPASFLLPRILRLAIPESVRRALPAALIAALVCSGFVRGALADFGVVRTAEQKDFLAIQLWARLNTPRDAMFYVPNEKEFGFSLFSRRPVWWDASQGGAVPWAPAWYNTWSCRRHLVALARTAQERDRLALDANIDYLVLDGGTESQWAGFKTAYRNGHFIVARRSAPRVATRLCQES